MTAKTKKLAYGAILVVVLILVYRYFKKKKSIAAQPAATVTEDKKQNGDKVVNVELSQITTDSADHDTDAVLMQPTSLTTMLDTSNVVTLQAAKSIVEPANSWTGDSCRTATGEWGTLQPDGSCAVRSASSFLM